MKILFATSEFADFIKAGGLGDVSASLPRALRRQGIDARVILPGYPEVIEGADAMSVDGMTIVAELPGRGALPPCRIGRARTPDGLVVYLVLAPALYERPGTPYCQPDGTDWADNDLRFARFSLAAAQLARGVGGLAWVPELLHVNDWPGGLAPAYLRWDGARVPVLQTIHNIAYQGVFDKTRMAALGIPEDAFDVNGLEFHGRISLLKAGVYYASHVSTVSPTYAREITTERFGAGLHGLTQGLAAEGRLSGIVNGIDDDWNPANDPHLPYHFEADDLAGKRAIADMVRTGLCLKQSGGPLFGIVSRLVHQKGLDIVAEMGQQIVREGGQIAVLGLGDSATEQMLSKLARSHRDHVAVLIGFNEPMARRIVAGCDFCLMPSRYEPCGLVQMQAQRYGALPIAHATGGLADTIEDGETGFLFSEFSGGALYEACRRAFEVYQDAEALDGMRQAAMARRFDWTGAAREYEILYGRLIGIPRAGSKPVVRSRPRVSRRRLDDTLGVAA